MTKCDDSTIREVEHIEVDGKIYVSVLDLIRCVDHVERDMIRNDRVVTTGNLLRWLRENLMKLLP
jgi:hypothetical protein